MNNYFQKRSSSPTEGQCTLLSKDSVLLLLFPIVNTKDVVCKELFFTFVEQDRIEDLQKYVEVLKQEKEQAQNLSSSGGSSLFSPSGNVRRVSTPIFVSINRRIRNIFNWKVKYQEEPTVPPVLPRSYFVLILNFSQ